MTERAKRPRDYAWAVFAVVMLLMLIAAIFNALWGLATRGTWFGALGVPLAGIFYWWLGMGAWRRTIWGAPRL
jgi:hypothetical protein